MSKIPEPICVRIFWATLIFLPLPHQVQSGIYCSWKKKHPIAFTSFQHHLILSPSDLSISSLHVIISSLYISSHLYISHLSISPSHLSISIYICIGGTKDTFSFLWMQLEWCWVWEVVGTLKPYSLFKKNWTSCTHRWWGCNFKHKCSHVLVQALALMLRPGGISTT